MVIFLTDQSRVIGYANRIYKLPEVGMYLVAHFFILKGFPRGPKNKKPSSHLSSGSPRERCGGSVATEHALVGRRRNFASVGMTQAKAWGMEARTKFGRCSETWTRTKISGFRVRCPTIRRSRKVVNIQEYYYSFR